MPDKTIEQRVKEIISNQLEVKIDQIKLESSFRDDLNADSLDAVELIMAFEEEFKTEMGKDEIPEEDAEKLTTVKAVLDYITNKGKISKEPSVTKSLEKPSVPPVPSLSSSADLQQVKTQSRFSKPPSSSDRTPSTFSIPQKKDSKTESLGKTTAPSKAPVDSSNGLKAEPQPIADVSPSSDKTPGTSS